MANSTSNDQILVEQLAELIENGHAHATLGDVVKGLPLKDIGVKPGGLPYSIWQLVEHIRITQWDILEFSRNPAHTSPKWPDEYWPAEDVPAGEKEWKESLRRIESDRKEFLELLRSDNVDLYTPFPHGDGQNLLREAMLIADHTSYHLGEILVIRRLLNNWKQNSL